MKLNEISTEEPGVYSAVRFSKKTADALIKYAKEIGVPNPLTKKELHTTIIYSPKPLPNFKPLGKISPPMIGTPKELELWDNRSNTSKVLVMPFDCPQLYQYFYKVSLQHGAPTDFLQYNSHITLSYDAKGFKLKGVKKFDGQLEIVEEYQEPLSS